MKINRTVPVAGVCYALPFRHLGYWVVGEMTHDKTAKWLARVLNERYFTDDEMVDHED